MRFGFIGAGNMAKSLALGLGEPALFADAGSGRAQGLAKAVGGEALDVAALVAACDVVFLAHKPAQLKAVADTVGAFSGVVVSVLAATPLAQLTDCYPEAAVVRVMPNIPVEYGVGVLALAEESADAPELEEYFERLGVVVRCPEAQFEILTAIAGCSPAFFALFAQALIAAATSRGMDPELAARAVNETMAGTAATLRSTGVDTEDLMKRVASPGGLTERALASFASSGLEKSVDDAVATVLGQ
jgi:pyrroline-5-carboxylate reductase